MDKSLFEELQKMIISVARTNILEENVTPETNLIDDLGFESVALVELIVTVEEHYGIEFEDNAMISAVDKVGDLEEYVINRIREMETRK